MVLSEVNQNIFNKYLGFNIYQIDDYLINKIYSFKYIFVKNDLETVRTIISDLGTKEESENLIKILQKDAYSEIQEITGSDSFNKLLQDCLK